MKLLQSNPTTPAVRRLNVANHPDIVSPEQVDAEIRKNILALTEENNAVWTSPDYDRREYVHSFFQYPAMMVPVVQKKIVEIIACAKPNIKMVIDPFMGSATALVACMESGLDIYGQDVNPLAVLIGKTRTGPYYPGAIKRKSKLLYSIIEADNGNHIEANFKGLKKWFREDVALELSKIVRAIKKEKKLAIRRLYWVVLAETIRLTSNDRTSTFKLHALPIEKIAQRFISPIETFKEQLQESIEDLQLYHDMLVNVGKISKGRYIGEKKICLADSSKGIFNPNKDTPYYDLLVTSPPYGDNKTTVTYGQHSYLPLQWINFKDIDDKADKCVLKTTLAIDSKSLGGDQERKLQPEEIIKLSERSSTFSKVYFRLSQEAPDKVKKVLVFINDLSKVIDNIFKVMKPDSYQVWTIGNRNVGGMEIPNSEILVELISNSGGILISKIEREIINKRMARRNNNSTLMNTEDILIFRKIG
jgi:hypothetical protein